MARLPATVLSPNRIVTAELCALDLWWGIDFVSGKHQTSDQSFLQAFTQIFDAIQAGSTSHLVPLKDEIGELMRVCQFWSHHINSSAFSLNDGAIWIESDLPNHYLTVSQSPAGLYDLRAAITAVQLLAPQFGALASHQTALASRVLFFLVPGFQIFNISNDLVKKVCKGASSKDGFIDFYGHCEEMMNVNASALNSLQMPALSSENSAKHWERAKKSNWWQRRVLDLALLLEHRLVQPRSDLQTNRP